MASDFAEAFRELMVLMFVGLCIFFMWEALRFIVFNTPDGDPTLKDMVIGFFKTSKLRRQPLPPPPPSSSSDKIKAAALPNTAVINDILSTV
ncbi:hypothetical protein PanWU01x14_073670 [Parasponia andersonii]|uniref:Transmembrane protein n=1 Tax=Parasponia andersonii TaxID=3476 RepID=A0A2P5DE91_PARAD|nr:hypothetical protein PanWU01x14_073670 [Parasponia andersonii]